MASSLEELLWEEGFTGRRSTDRPRHSTSMETMTRLLHPPRRSVSQQEVKMRTERTRSDISRYQMEVAASGSDRDREIKLRDDFARSGRFKGGSSKRETLTGGAEESVPSEFYKRKELIVEGKRGSGKREIVEIEEEEDLNSKFKDIYSNEVYISDSRRSSVSKSGKEVEGYIYGSSKDIKLEKMRSHDYTRILLGRTSSRNTDQEKTNEDSMPSNRSKRGSWNRKSFDRKRSEKRESSPSGASEPAMDQVAIQAVISILGGHIKPFLHDENFRNSLRVNCFASLNSNNIDGSYVSDNKVISNLEQAIETVERAVSKGESTKDLKKASLQLSVVTGLSSNGMKDAFTAEIPNYKLSACAHVYLSVIYKLQRKEKLSARHTLQVFCLSPFQARNLLLPELWEILFFPHLSHLKKWFSVEADILGKDPSKSKKLRFLEKVYNDALDSGTCQFASYYKDWLTEDTEAPGLPLIQIPTISVRGVKQNGSSSTSSELTSSPTGPFSPQPMVSRRLYDAVFNNNKHGADENAQHKVNYSPHIIIGSYGRSILEENQPVTDATEKVKYAEQDMEIMSSGNKGDIFSDQLFVVKNNSVKEGQLMIAKDLWQLQEALVQEEEGALDDEVINVPQWIVRSGNSQDLQAPCMKENERILKSLAMSVFKTQNLQVEALGDSESLYKESLFENAPQDFLCPLTGRLLSDPVTLETGQTFERAAIAEWLQRGNNSCPVTGKILEYTSVPLTNFILKRIVDNWKSDQLDFPRIRDPQKTCKIMEYRELENQSAFCILEQLLTGLSLSKDEKNRNANHLISLGGLEFLLQRFDYGNLEEAVTVAQFLLFCIEADPGCRFLIARDISKTQLFNLLHGTPAIERKYGVSLLSELVCLSRIKDVKIFFSSLPAEISTDSMNILLLYLQSLPLDQKPLISILILHFDVLLEEPQKNSIYREEAIDAILMAMDRSMMDESVRTSCCRALLIMGRCTFVSSIVQTGSDNIKEVGCNYSNSTEAADEERGVSPDKSMLLDDEEQVAREAWLRDVTISLLGSGRLSFVDMISKCLGSEFPELVRTCLITVAWLSLTLTSLPDAGFHLTVFSALISQLKKKLENNEPLEHRFLASVSLHNFSKFPECRVLLMKIGDELYVPLSELAKSSRTARELYTVLYKNDLALSTRASKLTREYELALTGPLL